MTKSQSSRHFIIFSLVGGVLLAAALSLIPQSASAYTKVYDSTDTNPSNGIGYSFNVSLKNGCLFSTADVKGSAISVLNDSYSNYNHTSACGWVYSTGYNDNLGFFASSQPFAFYRSYMNGSLISSSNNIIQDSVHDSSTVDSFPRLHSIIDSINVRLFESNNDSPSNILMPNSSFPDSRFIGHLSFALNNYNEINNQWAYGFPPGFNYGSVHFINLNNNRDLYDEDPNRYRDIIADISSHSVFYCSDSFASDHVPSGALIDGYFGDSSIICSAFFSIPNVPGYVMRISDGQFAFSSQNPYFAEELLDSYRGDLSAGNMSFVFRNLISYGSTTPSSRQAIFPWEKNVFQIFQCTSADECADFNNLSSLYNQDLISVSKNEAPQSGGGSIFDTFFKVFDFSFLFPFRSIFGMFDNSQCVEIPVIASMLNTGSTYCTWWSPTVRSILTPVFATFSLMLVTGFVFSWLTNGHAFTIDGTLARDSKNKAKGGK